MHSGEDLRQLYAARFEGAAEYRGRMWDVLTRYFERWIPADGAVLDLGCGYCEFINRVRCAQRYGMDLNPDSARFAKGATILEQNCSEAWQLPDSSLDTVFTSNFFEHLPTKTTLESTLQQAFRCLKPGGRLIAMGPNIRYTHGAYWDFFDHYLPLTDRSLIEVLSKTGFETDVCLAQFMPYTAVGKVQYPVAFIKAYLAIPLAWRVAGKQFLVVVRKPVGKA